jgi:cyclohexanone monooxygenase
LSVSAAEREAEFERRWALGGFAFLVSFVDLVTNREANAVAADFVHRKIREQVQDPVVAELLCPKEHPFGTKRMCVDTDYYRTYNRDNVTLVDVKSDPIAEITPTGLRLASGAGYAFDSLVLATGFDAMTGALFAIDIRGRDGESLRARWSAGPRSYLGLQVAGFPNMFIITGPGSPSVLSNMMVSIEQHVEWVTDCIAYLRERGIATIEAERDAEDRWVEHVNAVGAATLLPEANSWYMGANVPGKPRVFMPYVGGVGAYRKLCDEVVAKGYEGFALKA